ncbi:unnamed protein product [Calypogeia fissa]
MLKSGRIATLPTHSGEYRKCRVVPLPAEGKKTKKVATGSGCGDERRGSRNHDAKLYSAGPLGRDTLHDTKCPKETS